MLMKQYTFNVSIHLASSLSSRTAPIPLIKGRNFGRHKDSAYGLVAQSVEHNTFNVRVVGSIPAELIYTFLRSVVVAQVILSDLGMVRVLVEK